MTIFNKPSWWSALKTQYNFPDDGQPTITSYEMLQTLADHVTGHFDVLLSPGFMSTQRVAQEGSSDSKKLSIISIGIG